MMKSIFRTESGRAYIPGYLIHSWVGIGGLKLNNFFFSRSIKEDKRKNTFKRPFSIIINTSIIIIILLSTY